MEISVKNKRVTLFTTSPIQFNESLVNVYVEEFSKKGLVPSVTKGLGIRITPQGLVSEEVISLELKKLNETFKVSFGPDRIDIESNKSDEQLSEFLQLVKEVEQILSTKMHLAFIRLALCENVLFVVSEDQKSLAYHNILNSDEPSPVEWQFQNVKRSKLSSDGEQQTVLDINEVYTLKSPETTGNPIVVLDIDINTKPGPTSEQISAVKEAFWPYASEIIEKTKDIYKEKLFHGND